MLVVEAKQRIIGTLKNFLYNFINPGPDQNRNPGSDPGKIPVVVDLKKMELKFSYTGINLILRGEVKYTMAQQFFCKILVKYPNRTYFLKKWAISTMFSRFHHFSNNFHGLCHFFGHHGRRVACFTNPPPHLHRCKMSGR